MSEESWKQGLATGAFKNRGTRKRKKRGKPEKRGSLRYGAHRERMAKRRES